MVLPLGMGGEGISAGNRYNKGYFDKQIFSSVLLEVEQLLRLHPAGIAQACNIGPRR